MSVIDQIESETPFHALVDEERQKHEAQSAADSVQAVVSLEKTDLLFIAVIIQTVLLAYIAWNLHGGE